MNRQAAVSFDYAAFVGELTARISAARVAAARSVNTELVSLYWDIGAVIREKQTTLGWGDGVVDRLARDLKRTFPGATGFSLSNLWRMRQLHEVYTAPEFLAQAVREIEQSKPTQKAALAGRAERLAQRVREMVLAVPWGHHINLLLKVEKPAQRLFYLYATARYGWTRNVLLN